MLENPEVTHKTLVYLSSFRSSHVACFIASKPRSEFSEFLEGIKNMMNTIFVVPIMRPWLKVV